MRVSPWLAAKTERGGAKGSRRSEKTKGEKERRNWFCTVAVVARVQRSSSSLQEKERERGIRATAVRSSRGMRAAARDAPRLGRFYLWR